MKAKYTPAYGDRRPSFFLPPHSFYERKKGRVYSHIEF